MTIAPSQSVQLTIKLKNGSTRSFPVADITKITFGSITNVRDIENARSLIKTFTLFQNYPNPFNPTTTIRYELPGASEVIVTIFNIVGQLVRHYASNVQPAGSHEVVWDGTDDGGRSVASGLYIYRVAAGTKVVSKKMLFLK
ncbi:MAG: T9SS type A sorting domain-containing protein [Ignavibacteriae bacterium]|nr:T9SS type A sorting domain-containing protein [Ignavibacteria bacterium]MBI3364994.1 T9SS type A sorting domain-containing protein [Ignavibacteriota bacterium]